jgi:hypothetical protein
MEFASSQVARLAFAIATPLIGAIVAISFAFGPQVAVAATENPGGTLAGTWTGVLTGSASSARQHVLIVMNAAESAGTWKLSRTCHGRLTLVGVSGGYHHYRRRLAAGASCAGGDIDCLMRVGANLYDTVTPHPGGAAVSGTLRRAQPY